MYFLIYTLSSILFGVNFRSIVEPNFQLNNINQESFVIKNIYIGSVLFTSSLPVAKRVSASRTPSNDLIILFTFPTSFISLA